MTSEEERVNIPTYRILGNSGLRVFPIALGCMQFGSNSNFKAFGCSCEEDESAKVLTSYVEAGGNFIDTAVNYQLGQSEEMIGRLIKKLGINRDRLVIATKYTSSVHGNDDPNMMGNQSKNMYYSVQKSLERLQTDYIDLLYVHFWGFGTPMETIMRQLDDIVRSGKVRHIAISDTHAWIVSAMQEKAKAFGWHKFCAYQGRYSLVERDMEQEIVPMCEEYDCGIVPWGVVGRGALAGVRSKEDMVRKAFTPEVTEKVQEVQKLLVKIGEERKQSAASVAMNWCLNKKGITSILVGPRNDEQMKDSLTACNFNLSKEEMGELDEMTKGFNPLIFPTNFIGNSLEGCEWYNFPKKFYNLEKKK